MKRFLAKIWVPLLLVIIAAIQSFGIDASRAVGFKKLTDSLAHNNLADTTDVKDSIILPAADSIHTDSTLIDSVAIDSAATKTEIQLVLSAKDTIKVPDSLKESDPLKYKYYIALRDSSTRAQLRDSLITAGDTLELHILDSLYIKDSTDAAIARHEAWYASASRRERILLVMFLFSF